MIQYALNLCEITMRLVKLINGIHLAQTMHAHILRKPESLRGALNVSPDGLSCPMLSRVLGALKNPPGTRLGLKISQKRLGKIYTPTLTSLLLSNPKLRAELIGADRNHVTNPEPRCNAHPADKTIGGSKRR